MYADDATNEHRYTDLIADEHISANNSTDEDRYTDGMIDKRRYADRMTDCLFVCCCFTS